jgi:hypothetical protein
MTTMNLKLRVETTSLSITLLTFDDFGDVEIASNSKKKFILVVDIVDGPSAVGGSINVSLVTNSVEGQDEDNNDIGCSCWIPI